MSSEIDPKNKTTNEQSPKPGDYFIAGRIGPVHILEMVSFAETPGGNDGEEYIGKCGAFDQSWYFPSSGGKPTQFLSRSELNAINQEVNPLCQPCFVPKKDSKVKESPTSPTTS